MLNLIFSIDQNFADAFKVCVYSIKQTSKKLLNSKIYVLYSNESLSKKTIEELKKYCVEKIHVDIEFLDCSKYVSTALKWNENDHVTIATYFRLFASKLIPEEVEKVLYLDADLIVAKNISYLCDVDMGEKLIGAVDHYSPQDGIRLWGDGGGDYFNAGVLLMNLKQMRLENINNKYMTILINNKNRIKWHDQDVLNIAHQNDWIRLPWRLNGNTKLMAALQMSVKEYEIIHYDGWNKPWAEESIREGFDIWLSSKNCSSSGVYDVKKFIKYRSAASQYFYEIKKITIMFMRKIETIWKL